MPKQSETVELALKDNGTLSVADLRTAVTAGHKIRLAERDSETQQAAILDRKLAASTTADLLNPDSEAVKAKDVIDQPMRLVGAHFQNSDEAYLVEGSIGIYTVLEVEMPGRGSTVVSCGATDVVLTAARWLELGAEPVWVKITKSTTAGGFTVYNLVGAHEPVVDDSGVAF